MFWDDVASVVRARNARLADAIDQLASGSKQSKRVSAQRVRQGKATNDLSLFKVSYPYGHLMVNEGTFVPPCLAHSNENHTASLCSDCAELAESVGYSPIPLTLVLQNSAEVFLPTPSLSTERGTETIPLRLLNAGEMFGVFEVLDVFSRDTQVTSFSPPWSVSAGARSVHILAPLGAQGLRNRIIGMLSEPDRQMAPRGWEYGMAKDHWIFIQLLAGVADPNWKTTVLIFPTNVVMPNGHSEPGEFRKDLYIELGRIAWTQSQNLREAAVEEYDHLSAYVRGIEHFGERPPLDRTVRFLIKMARGEALGSSPDLDETSGPFLPILEFLGQHKNDIYGPNTALQSFPFILTPGYINPGKSERSYAYFSLTKSQFQGHPIRKTYADDLQDIKDRLRSLNDDPDTHLRSLVEPLDEHRTMCFAQVDHSSDISKARNNPRLGVKSFMDFLDDFSKRDFAEQYEVLQKYEWTHDLHRAMSNKGFCTAFIRVVRT